METTRYENGPSPRSGRRRRGGRGPNRNLLIIVGAAVLVVVIAIVVGVVAMGGGGDGKKGAAGPSKALHVMPKVYVDTPANSLVKKLNSRAKDKRPLNQGEVFDVQAKSLKHGAYTFNLTGSELSADCTKATWGGQLQTDLKQFGCTQLARGAYVSADKKFVGQFIAINMADLKGAQQVVRDLNPDSNAGFVSPLTAKGAENFGSGFSAAYSQPFGHFVVISWVERAGGGQPQTMNELLDASIAIERADDFVWERLVLANG